MLQEVLNVVVGIASCVGVACCVGVAYIVSVLQISQQLSGVGSICG